MKALPTSTRLLLAWAAGTFLPGVLTAAVSLPGIFQSSMVLQQQKPIPVWGSAAPGETFRVELGQDSLSTTADAQGHWSVQFPPHEAGGPYTLKVGGETPIVLNDILIGEVWLCSGQSNMEWNLRGISLPETLAAACVGADDPQLRTVMIKRTVALEPQTQHQTEGGWQAASAQTVPNFSATAYFFGRHLRQHLKVPVGLVVSALGGTPSQSWTSQEALEKDPAFAAISAEWQKRMAAYPEARRHYDQVLLPKWQEEVKKAKAQGKPTPRKPGEPAGPTHSHRPAGLFNAMIAPLIPFAMRGVIWYQGESNADTMAAALQYGTLFPTLINDWRTRWQNPQLPFYFVQLANFKAPQSEPVENTPWPVLREAQTRTLALPATGMALAIDLNDEPTNIHPRNKAETGRRLALVALAQTYGLKIPYSGPRYTAMTRQGGKLRVEFTHAQGLKVKGEKLLGFALAGKDGKFFWAQGEIDGETVLLQSPEVAEPTAVRYNWAMNPIGNLYNQDGLPAAPFRSDE